MGSSKKRPLVVMIEAALAAALLSACGGGGSESEPMTSAASPTSDAAQPTDADTTGTVAEGDGADEPTRDGSVLAAADTDGHDAPPVGDVAELGEEPPIVETSVAAEDSERESAQKLSYDYADRYYAKPKVAALDYENNITTSRRDYLAKFRFVILGARSGSRLNTFAGSIKAKRPDAIIASYSMVSELKCYADSSSYHYPMVTLANQYDFWLRYASGSRVQWTTAYGNCDTNISRWGRKTSSGSTWMQKKAAFDHDKQFKYSTINYAFVDNWNWRPRKDADWKRIDTNQSKYSSEIQSAMRNGYVNYWNALKSRRSSLRVIGNSDGDLSHYEYDEKLHGAFFEGAMGRSWSIESWAGWGAMRERYRKLISNTVWPNHVFLQVYGSNTNYKLMRYGLASAMLENGWFVHLPSSGTLKSAWFDEYEAPIGKPIESPPTSAKSNGIWARKYENGMVLVNPTSSSRSINVGTSYRRMKGSQDPYVNNGNYVSTVTLPARSGLLLLRR